MENKQKWIIVSNRLPVQIDSKSGQIIPSSGGLVSALRGITSKNQIYWAGIISTDSKSTESDTKIALNNFNSNTKYIPLFVDPKTYDSFYNGFCNDVLWPLFHYESQMVKFKNSDWKSYIKVNKLLAEKIARIARPKDAIWIHDFHLFLLPKFLKELGVKCRIGFFLHIPFPSSEIFRQLPVREEILDALLNSDLIGFHDYSYLRHFTQTLISTLGINCGAFNVLDNRYKCQFGVYPASIDYDQVNQLAASKNIRKWLNEFRPRNKSVQIILGVDRLDYIKGLDLKLKAFQTMLRKHPKMIGQVRLVQITVPSRMDVPEYQNLKSEIDQLVGEINGEFGGPNYTPVNYIFSSISIEELIALYQLADVLFVTSKRDGMNLVVLEYIASQLQKNPGNIVLSEFAGASSHLSHALTVNPWDIENTAKTLEKACTMDRNERKYRHSEMKTYLKRYDSEKWGNTFINDLQQIEMADSKNIPTLIDPNKKYLGVGSSKIIKLDKKNKLFLFLDYDGTIVPICPSPDQAVVNNETQRRLKILSKQKNIQTVVVSGRPADFLRKQFKDLPFYLAAEHGSKFFDYQKGRWKRLAQSKSNKWYQTTKKILEDYSTRVPQSWVEEKSFSIAWHYRNSPKEFGDYMARRLVEQLEIGLHNLPITVLLGKKVVEVRDIDANKGRFAHWFLDRYGQGEFDVLSVGDDRTDEDMFEYVNNLGVTIRVGQAESSAQFCLGSQEEVIKLLDWVSSKSN